MSVTPEVIAIALTAVVHVIGAAVLVWAMFDGENTPDWRSLWPRDDDGGGGRGPEDPPEPPLGGDGPGLLPESRPARTRLRTPARLADSRPRPARRPEHPPEPTRAPQRSDA